MPDSPRPAQAHGGLSAGGVRQPAGQRQQRHAQQGEAQAKARGPGIMHSGGDVAGIILREGLALAAAGLGLGMLATVGLERLIGHSIFGLPPLHFGVSAAALIALALLAVAGAYASARRAAHEEPWAALRRD